MHTPPRTRSQPRALATCLTTSLAFVALLALPLAQAATSSSSSSSSSSAAAPAPQVRVTTNMGDFVIELAPDRAPLTVANFMRYVKEGFYSGTLIHRVIGNFLIQGGGYNPDWTVKPTHDPVFNESGNGLQNTRGAVGLARLTAPHSGNSQWFINVRDNSDTLDPLPSRWGYAVFGRVVQGMEVVDSIAVVATGPAGPFKSEVPQKPVIVQKVELVEPSAAQTPAATPVAPHDTILSPQ